MAQYKHYYLSTNTNFEELKFKQTNSKVKMYIYYGYERLNRY